MSIKELKIGQISDIHVGEDDDLVQGIDVRANFMAALTSPTMEGIDLLILSGDLANEDAEPGAYDYILEELKKLTIPYCVIPGNHDRIEVMKKHFDLRDKVHNGKCYYRYDIGGRSIFLIDSANGTVSAEQLDWLKKECDKIDDEVILFLHHPPCLCNHQFMDSKYSLKNIDEVQKALAEIPNLTHIFTGHYHCEFEISIGRQKVHVTPSTQMQIEPSAPVFKLKSTNPGWRIIEWGKKELKTSVYFK